MGAHRFYSIEGVCGSGKTTLLEGIRALRADTMRYLPTSDDYIRYDRWRRTNGIPAEPSSAQEQLRISTLSLQREAAFAHELSVLLADADVLKTRDFASVLSFSYAYAQAVQAPGLFDEVDLLAKRYVRERMIRVPDLRLVLRVNPVVAVERQVRRGRVSGSRMSDPSFLAQQQEFLSSIPHAYGKTVILDGQVPADALVREAMLLMGGG